MIGLLAVWFHLFIISAFVRTRRWVDFFDGKLAELEKLDAEPDGLRVKVFSDDVFTRVRNHHFTNTNLLLILTIGVSVVWVAKLFYHAVQLVKT